MATDYDSTSTDNIGFSAKNKHFASIENPNDVNTTLQKEVTDRNTAIKEAVNDLNVDFVGQDGQYINSVKEEAGLVATTSKAFSTELSDDATTAPTTASVFKQIGTKDATLSDTGFSDLWTSVKTLVANCSNNNELNLQLPTGYTYVIKNKEQFVKWATESHTTSDKYTAVLIDLDSAASIEDITTTDNYLVNCTNTKIVAMTDSSAALAFTGTTLETTFHCNSNVKFINVNVFSDTHKYCINGAGLVDRCSITMNASTSDTFGLEKCVLVTDCNITSSATLSHSAYGIDACSAVVNTSAIARGAHGYGYSYCGSITNCIDYGSTTYGAFTCTKVINFIGTTNTCTADIGTSAGVTTTIGNTTDAANNTFYGTATTAVNVNGGTINATTGTFSGTVTAPTFNGALSGNATTATTLIGNITNANVTGTMPIGANYIQYYSSTYPATNVTVTPSSLFGGTWAIIAASNITTL